MYGSGLYTCGVSRLLLVFTFRLAQDGTGSPIMTAVTYEVPGLPHVPLSYFQLPVSAVTAIQLQVQ